MDILSAQPPGSSSNYDICLYVMITLYFTSQSVPQEVLLWHMLRKRVESHLQPLTSSYWQHARPARPLFLCCLSFSRAWSINVPCRCVLVSPIPLSEDLDQRAWISTLYARTLWRISFLHVFHRAQNSCCLPSPPSNHTTHKHLYKPIPLYW
jgi:hypothetical protein